jgi:hypothetical protein
MKRFAQTLAVALTVVGLLVSVASADAAATAGTISKVTVYRGQALVTRTINADLAAGSSELIQMVGILMMTRQVNTHNLLDFCGFSVYDKVVKQWRQDS